MIECDFVSFFPFFCLSLYLSSSYEWFCFRFISFSRFCCLLLLSSRSAYIIIRWCLKIKLTIQNKTEKNGRYKNKILSKWYIVNVRQAVAFSLVLCLVCRRFFFVFFCIVLHARVLSLHDFVMLLLILSWYCDSVQVRIHWEQFIFNRVHI